MTISKQDMCHVFRIRYSSMPPPNHKLPLDLDVNSVVKELTVGEKGYVLIPGVFTKEEVDMARLVFFELSAYHSLVYINIYYKTTGKRRFT